MSSSADNADGQQGLRARIGERIKWFRRQRLQIGREAMADAVGVKRQSVYAWEEEGTWPGPEKLLRIQHLYGLSLDFLLTGDAPVLKLRPRDLDEIAWIIQEKHGQAARQLRLNSENPELRRDYELLADLIERLSGPEAESAE